MLGIVGGVAIGQQDTTVVFVLSLFLCGICDDGFRWMPEVGGERGRESMKNGLRRGGVVVV